MCAGLQTEAECQSYHEWKVQYLFCLLSSSSDELNFEGLKNILSVIYFSLLFYVHYAELLYRFYI